MAAAECAATQALKELKSNMRTSLKLYDDRAPSAEPEASGSVADRIRDLCTVCHKVTTQMQIAFSGSEVTGAEVLVGEASESLNALMIVTWQSTTTAGEVMLGVVKGHVQGLVQSVCDFIDAVLDKKRPDAKVQKQFLGMVWAQLEALQKLKISNRAHITTALHATLGQVKDARREVKQGIEQLGEDDSELMQQTWHLIGVIIELANRLAIAAVVQQPEPADMSAVQAMEIPIKLVDSFSVLVDDLVISLDDYEEEPMFVRDALDELVSKANEVIDHVGATGVVIDDMPKLIAKLEQHKLAIIAFVADDQ